MHSRGGGVKWNVREMKEERGGMNVPRVYWERGGDALVQCRGLQEERMCVVFTLNAIYLYLLDLMMTLVSFHSNSLLLLVHSSHSELWYVVVMLLNPLVTEMKWVKREKEKVRSAWNFERTKFAHDPWKSPFLPFRSMS